MDQIVKADVDEEQIAPFMQDISRYFEYVDKDDLIKKIVSMEFGKFLAYYADAPEISPVSTGKEKREKGSKAEKGKKGATPTSRVIASSLSIWARRMASILAKSCNS